MNNIDFHGIEEIWSSLSTSSLLWLTVTLAAYLFAQKLYKWSNWNSLLNPVAVSIVTVVILLMATHTPYQTYFSGAQFIHFLLGPTTVALAVPLYDLRIQLAKNWLPILLGLFAGRRHGNYFDGPDRRTPRRISRNHHQFGAEECYDPDCHVHRRKTRRPARTLCILGGPDRRARFNLRGSLVPASEGRLFFCQRFCARSFGARHGYLPRLPD